MCGACKGIEGFLQGFTGLEMVLYVVLSAAIYEAGGASVYGHHKQGSLAFGNPKP